MAVDISEIKAFHNFAVGLCRIVATKKTNQDYNQELKIH